MADTADRDTIIYNMVGWGWVEGGGGGMGGVGGQLEYFLIHLEL